MTRDAMLQEVIDSGLRGRGGAGFPTGIKWKTVSDAPADQKYIICNADEGDSGTFADRMIMEGDPFTLIEGMTIAGLATGATRGYVYMRSEYPDAVQVMAEAVRIARDAGLLGPSVMGSGRAFDMDIRVGAGAYVCGEETSLLNSLEGKRGVVRAKPPLPALEGFFGKPTVVNNVISLASIPVIFDKGAAYYRDFGLGRSRGTIPLQIAGNVRRGGLFEIAFGMSLGQIVDDIAGGTATGRPQNGSGTCLRNGFRSQTRTGSGAQERQHLPPRRADPHGPAGTRHDGRIGIHTGQPPQTQTLE